MHFRSPAITATSDDGSISFGWSILLHPTAPNMAFCCTEEQWNRCYSDFIQQRLQAPPRHDDDWDRDD